MPAIHNDDPLPSDAGRRLLGPIRITTAIALMAVLCALLQACGGGDCDAQCQAEDQRQTLPAAPSRERAR